jgi:hypothetical protein
VECHSFPHAEQAVAVVLVCSRTGPVVCDLEAEPMVGEAHGDACLRWARVLERVGERFLNDPIGGQIDSGWKARRLALDVQVDRQPRCANVLN